MSNREALAVVALAFIAGALAYIYVPEPETPPPPRVLSPPGVAPGFCDRNPNSLICSESSFCGAHPNHKICRYPGSSWCQAHPNHARCKDLRVFCKKQPGSFRCKQPIPEKIDKGQLGLNNKPHTPAPPTGVLPSYKGTPLTAQRQFARKNPAFSKIKNPNILASL